MAITHYVGCNGNNALKMNSYSSYETCNAALELHTHERNMLNNLFSICETIDFIKEMTLQYETLCWWFEGVKRDKVSDDTQRHFLVLIYKSTKDKE